MTKKPDWRNLTLDGGILAEPTPEANRLVLWLPGHREGGFQYWERIGNLPGAAVEVVDGLCATAATSMPARQRIHGFFGRLLHRLRKLGTSGSWVLPSGESAQQAGDKQTDLALVWAEDDSAALDEARLKAAWPRASHVRKLGPNLFVVSGVKPATTSVPAADQLVAGANNEPASANPGQQAEKLLAAARQRGERPAEVSALIDLGIACMRTGALERAVGLLDEALVLARQLGDKAREMDAVGNLGSTLLAAGKADRARELLEQNLALARAAGDRFEEKLALERLGLLHFRLRDHTGAIAAYDQALTLARAVGDRHHQAELLWYLAVQNAALGQRDEAINRAQAALDLFQQLGNPHVGWLGENLRKYRLGDPGAGLWGTGEAQAGSMPGAFFGTWTTGAATGQAFPGAGPGQAATGPGLLHMAIAAVKSMARFLTSGLKTVPAPTYQARLRSCAACPHHTGVRCKLCGCFTSVKAWMPHEHCPIEKWPA
jgi:tetratricopeptide (TPR) repeat protein